MASKTRKQSAKTSTRRSAKKARASRAKAPKAAKVAKKAAAAKPTKAAKRPVITKKALAKSISHFLPTTKPRTGAVPLEGEQTLLAFQMQPWVGMIGAQQIVPRTPAGMSNFSAAMALSAPAAASELLNSRLATVDRKDPDKLDVIPMSIPSAMDPRLQLALANSRVGKPGLELASTAGDEVAVLARVKSVPDWESLADVDPGVYLGAASDGTHIVTARFPIRRVEAVRADPNVVSLKSSQPVYPNLKATIETLGVDAASLPRGTKPDGGRGVVIGIIDFGCDFAHTNFRFKNGKTRLLAIWHQGASTQPRGSAKYGRVYTQDEINSALAAANPYIALGYGPRNEAGGTHGTHVMDIAAGNGNGSGQPGVAPEADLVFVEAAAKDIAWQGPESVNQSFGDSVQLSEAVHFIFDMAGDRPCIINISLGTNGGPHDGSSVVEQGFDAIVKAKPNRAIVIAASNSQNDGIHTSGRVPAGEVHSIVWRQQTAGGGEFELWYEGARRLEVTLVAPDGTRYGPVAPADNLALGDPGKIAVFISSRLNDPNNHDNAIGIWLAGGMSEKNFIIELRSLDDEPVDYHAWIERNDRNQASFETPVFTHTLGSISTGHKSIVVGSYDAHKPACPISTFSSAGPTRDGRNKPEVSAPGQFVWAAKSGSGNGTTKKSGTSMAAPAVTGLIALMLAEAVRTGQQLSIDEIRARLQQTALRNPPGTGAWDHRYGDGRVHGASIGQPAVVAARAAALQRA